MWGERRKLYEDLAAERARREELTRRVDAQQATIAFLCARVNQVEAERALLFRQLTNIEVPVPQLQVAPTAADPSSGDLLEAISALGIFADDPRHAPAGWHADGSVNYGRMPDPAGAVR